MRAALEQLSALRHERCVLVIGDVMLDEYVWGDAARLSPEAPVPVVQRRGRSAVIGGAANAAANVAAFGTPAQLVGAVGADAEGDEVRRLLAGAHVGDHLLTDDTRPTTLKTRIMASEHQIARLDREDSSPVNDDLVAAATEQITARVRKAAAVLISDYAKGFLTEAVLRATLDAARDAGVPCVVDPKARNFSVYRGATAITPNAGEARAAAERLVDSTEIDDVGEVLIRLLPATAVVVTMGPKGMRIFREGRGAVQLEPRARRVFDVTGAGDTVAAILAVGLACDLDLADATKIASFAAGLAVERVGTTAITFDEIAAAVVDDPEPAH